MDSDEKHGTTMRPLSDRIRHTVLFEALALGIVAFGGSWATGHSPEALGTLGIMFSVIAMSWNMLFNWLFDVWDRKYRNSAKRGFALRAVHAVLFEAVLIVVGIFLVAWWLDISYWDAFILDLGFSAFFLVYAFAYNWTYDIVFPRPVETAVEASA